MIESINPIDPTSIFQSPEKKFDNDEVARFAMFIRHLIESATDKDELKMLINKMFIIYAKELPAYLTCIAAVDPELTKCLEALGFDPRSHILSNN